MLTNKNFKEFYVDSNNLTKGQIKDLHGMCLRSSCKEGYTLSTWMENLRSYPLLGVDDRGMIFSEDKYYSDRVVPFEEVPFILGLQNTSDTSSEALQEELTKPSPDCSTNEETPSKGLLELVHRYVEELGVTVSIKHAEATGAYYEVSSAGYDDMFEVTNEGDLLELLGSIKNLNKFRVV